ncbi:methyl-CpG-binding domain-containing protein 6-like [Solanum verrucosum]|uniref:methyl-CpG-binding domain-containing protein 6-like n=1 Tax=Solanum verrucosum TaxID=315347 RepID=UPI0020D0BE4E|nr:methyl-CpG-binding domain-containing protein 6-like [Solanum verrucosum]
MSHYSINFFSTLTLSKLPPMTKVDAAISSIPLTIVTSDDFHNDGIPSDPLLLLGSYIDVELDVRVETTTPNNSDVPNEGKVSDVNRSKLQIKRKITPMCRVNPDRPEWLPNNWTFETIARTGGASARQKDSYYFEPVSGSKFRSKPEVNHFLKTGLKREKLDPNRDVATPFEGKKQKKSGSKKEKKNVD